MTKFSAKDAGLFLLRTGVGATLVAHGTQKLFGWFGGHGLEQTANGFEQMGFEPGHHNALAAGLGEAGGGALLTLGLATPAAGAAALGTMSVASTMHTPNGFFNTEGGYEYPAMLGLASAALAVAGAGRLSLDHALSGKFDRPWMRAFALATVPAAVSFVLGRRRKALAAKAN